MPQRLSRGFYNHIADAENGIFRTTRCLPFKGAVLCESHLDILLLFNFRRNEETSTK